MKLLLKLIVVFVLVPTILTGQEIYKLSIQVIDEEQLPLPGAAIILSKINFYKGNVTDKNGSCEISDLENGKYTLEISFVGYTKHTDTIDITANRIYYTQLKPSSKTLDEVVIKDNYSIIRKQNDPMNIEVVNNHYVRANLAGSLMKSLENIPGISAIEIGSGQSKPLIRGLGFNRVVVVENGIKHEGQQWGAEHGLEIDQYAIDQIEIIKGPASLAYGPDAISGVIDLKQRDVPAINSFGGSIDFTGKSNNNFLGISAGIYFRKKSLYLTSRFTITDYADYKVPADSVDIYSYRAPLYKNRLRNTAGKEQSAHISIGSIGEKISTRLFISNIKSKSGFFANAHGLEPRMVDTELHDNSDRDIQYPYQEVNHFKIIGNLEYRFSQFELTTELGFQNNYRQEWSQYVSHGYMPPEFPEAMPFPEDLELEFNKNVYTGNIKGLYKLSENLILTGGLSSEYQNNKINGRGFIIPAFTQYTYGVFGYGKITLSPKVLLHLGLRYDHGNTDIKKYQDWFLSPVIDENNDTTGYEYLQRSPDLNRQFNSFCWSIGLNYNNESFSLKANAGKSFRMPIAKELATNGVNYHHFSYEVGDPDLDAEISYQFDLGIEWSCPRFALGLNPFVNYFPNYIYLNPSYEHDYLYGAGNQVYYYTQSEVFRIGGELHVHYDVLKRLQTGVVGEYVYSEQLSGEKKGFTLPFSSPANIILNLKYQPRLGKIFIEPAIMVDFKIVAAQNKIVPPEKKTPAYELVNISAGSQFRLKEQIFSVNFQVRNLLNTKYFNHTSYYRLINVPEPARSFILNITVPFNKKFENKKQ